MGQEYKKMVLIGLGFFACCALWTVYGNYVPLILNTHIKSAFLIGLVTSVTNSLGAVLHPVFGMLSDKTSTRLGRRMLFLLIGIPLSAFTLVLISSTGRLAVLLLLLTVFNVTMSVWRTPSFALMPDLIPSAFRSQANGVVNFMGGLGTLLISGIGGLLFKAGGMKLPFLAAATVALLALLVMKLFLREPATPVLPDEYAQGRGEAAAKTVCMDAARRKHILIAVLCALLLYSVGIGAAETFFSLYVTTALTDPAGNPLTGGDASLLMGLFSFSFMLFSIPAGFIAGHLGRKSTILLGLIGITVLFFTLYFVNLSILLLLLLILSGICCALINSNFLPAVTELARHSSFGRYTGYYHLVTFGSTIISPLLFGLVRDWAGTYRILFLYSGIASLAAIVPLLLTAKGTSEAATARDQADVCL